MTLLWLLLVLFGTGQPAPPPGGAHDFHVTYSQMAVEGKVAACRIRFFKDDLEQALRLFAGREEVRLAASPQVDSLFLAYAGERLVLEVDEQPVAATITGSGEDMLDREPVWWYMLQFEAPTPIRSFRLKNTLLFDTFDDQKHIVKVAHFPDEKQKTYYFAAGEEAFDVAF